MNKIISIDGNRYALPADMSAKDIQSLAGFLVTLTKVDYEWMYGEGENVYYATEGASVSVSVLTLDTKEAAKAKSAESRRIYDAKEAAKKAAESGDLIARHVAT
jgi:hypothetical protein